MTTAASRPGGKLRGKFAGRGKVLPPTSNNNNNDGNDTAANNNSSSNNPSSSTAATTTATTATTTTTKDGENNRDNNTNKNRSSSKVTMEMIQSQRSKIKRHEVFDKLDEAEGIILDILNIAKDTTKGFQFLASSPSERSEACTKNTNGQKETSQTTAPNATATATATATTDTTDKNDNDNDDKTNNDEKASITINNNKEKITERSEEEWKNQIRHNGKSYMNKLKQIHDLLTPHSNLVVNYGTISSLEESNTNSTSTITSTITNTNTTTAATSQNTTIGTITNGITNNNNDNEKKRKRRNNMYASRLEMRLAIDKKNLMNDLVQSEKKIFEEEMKTLKSTLGAKSNGNTIMDTATATTATTATPTVNTSNAINNSNSDIQMIDGNSQKRKREE